MSLARIRQEREQGRFSKEKGKNIRGVLRGDLTRNWGAVVLSCANADGSLYLLLARHLSFVIAFPDAISGSSRVEGEHLVPRQIGLQDTCKRVRYNWTE